MNEVRNSKQNDELNGMLVLCGQNAKQSINSEWSKSEINTTCKSQPCMHHAQNSDGWEVYVCWNINHRKEPVYPFLTPLKKNHNTIVSQLRENTVIPPKIRPSNFENK